MAANRSDIAQRTIPIVRSSAGLPLSVGPVLDRLPRAVESIAMRAPLPNDSERWRHHTIGGVEYEIAQPVTFTPYAGAQPCSARCRFCSENLREAASDNSASTRRPAANYFETLDRALHELEGLPIGYSLSGLETTDDVQWMSRMLASLTAHARRSPVEDRVLYTNAAGLLDSEVIARLVDFELDWAEISRHHFDAIVNDSIMRFRAGTAVRDQQIFEKAVKALARQVPIKLVCIVQSGGIGSADAMRAYLDWAVELGAHGVIFREFSQLDARYKLNNTARYIATQRVSVAKLLEEMIASQPLQVVSATEGYYFWNVIARYNDLQVVFEASDYDRMHRMHASGRIYKLVLHTNGNLCGGWNPDTHVLRRADK